MFNGLKRMLLGKDVIAETAEYCKNLIALSISAAKCDGPINDKEEKAILHSHNGFAYAEDWYRQLLSATVDERSFPGLMDGRGPEACFRVLRNFYSIMCADAPLNRPEDLWIIRFAGATNIDDKTLKTAADYYCGRETGGKDAPIHRFVVIPGGPWKEIGDLSKGEVVVCTDCLQKNRLPSPEGSHLSRCGRCHAYLALDKEQAEFMAAASKQREQWERGLG